MNSYLDFLRKLYLSPKRFQSDFCRYHAFSVAEASSRGHISSLIGGQAQQLWRVTTEGIAFLDRHKVELSR